MNCIRELRLSVLLSLSFLLAASFAESKGIYVEITEIQGVAKIQRAGQQKWGPARTGNRLYNNDMIKVDDESKATLKWANGSKMYVHPNSQILINLYNNVSTDFLSKHATVFYGAIFFVVKKTVPREMATRFDHKVYTPTAVLAIRGTAFSVQVDKDRGDTRVSVLSGTVLVGNILKKQSTFLSAGYTTTVLMNADPLQPQALMEDEITALKTWVPADVIDEEMKRQISKARKDHLAITGKLEDKLLLVPFSNTSGYSGPWQLSTLIPNDLGNRIKKDMNELKIMKAEASTSDAIQAGTKEKARFVLTGEIKTFELAQRAEISVSADEYKEYVVARVGILVQLIDVESRKMLFEGNALGEVSGGNDWVSAWKEIGKEKFDLGNKEFAKNIIAQASEQALDQSASDITRYLRQRE